MNHIYLTAQWKIWTRTIRFDKNCEDNPHITAVPDDILVNRIDYVDLSEYTPTIEGTYIKEFVGWSLTPNGEVIEDSWVLIPDKLDADPITLYAVWQ